MQKSVNQWLLERGISEEVLTRFNIHERDGEIVIPIDNQFCKFRKNPFAPSTDYSPKYRYQTGAKVTLYNKEALNHPDDELIVINEGELDTLVLESQGLHACTSTGGAMSFQKEWCPLFKDKTNVIICLDSDEVGLKGAIRIQQMIPHARILVLPTSDGVKDITDYFKGHNLKDFLDLPAMSYNIPSDLEPPYSMSVLDKKIKELVMADEQISELARQNYGAKHLNIIRYIIMEKYELYKKLRASLSRNKDDGVMVDIEKAKQRSIEEFIKFKSGYAPCIWHSERSASMFFYRHDGHVKCFGCSKRGDVIDVVQQLQGISFTEAVKFLNQ